MSSSWALMVTYIVFTICVIIALVLLYKALSKRKYLNSVLSQFELDVIKKQLSVVSFLDEHQKENFRRVYREFLYDKKFVGCAGLEITEEIKIVVAAGASLLVVNRPKKAIVAYSALKWIYIYPAAFMASREVRDEYGVVSKEQVGMLGESWDLGRVVLSWSDVEHGLQDFNDGNNVLFHEFAHQLDSESGSTNGSPLLVNRQAYASWAKVLSKEFVDLQADAKKGRRDVLDHYGATNPAEFFAVATETFFEKPEKLKRTHQALYKELSEYYGFDPCLWK